MHCYRALAAAAVALGLSSGSASASDPLKAPLILRDSGSFFVAGKDTAATADSSSTSTTLPYDRRDVIRSGQMYVSFQVPVKSAHMIPVIMVHGCCLSGKTYEDTPDGRMGWQEYFVRRHHAVYVPDQIARGRSGFDPTIYNDVRLGTKPASALPELYTFGRARAWDLFRFGPHYPETFPGVQFPTEVMGDFADQVIPDLVKMLGDPNPNHAALANLSTLAGGAVVLGHSQSAAYPFFAALEKNAKIKGIISVEGNCPAFDAPQIRRLAKIPIIVVFGDYIDKSDISKKFWPDRLQACRTLVDRLTKSGGKATLAYLPDMGFKGNSHMLMMDRNNLAIADMLLRWINRNVDQRHDRRSVGKNRDLPDD